jgi:hypothetical protein
MKQLHIQRMRKGNAFGFFMPPRAAKFTNFGH